MRPIVGRAAEQATIAGALSRTADGAGALLLVGGPAGIGKSALADMAVTEASRAGLRVARGYAVDDPGAPPLWPWRRVLPSESPSGSRRRPPLGDGDAAARFELFA